MTERILSNMSKTQEDKSRKAAQQGDLRDRLLRRIGIKRDPGDGPDHPDLLCSSLVPDKAGDRLRLFSLNVAHGRRTAAHQALLKESTARNNVSEIARVLRHVGPDLVALQEADGPSAWSGNFDHVATLADHAELSDHYRGNHNHFGSERFPLASGTAILSAWELQDPYSLRFGTNWRDTKGFVVASVQIPDWGGLEVDVVSVHLDFLRPSLRKRQILKMVNALIHRRKPMVILGDLNCCWQQEPGSMRLFNDMLGLRAYRPERSTPTFPVQNPKRRLDWILVSEQLDFDEYHTLKTPLSDHLGVVADLRLR